MIQPGVLVISHTREIRYYWSSIPSPKNLYGARSRPKPLDVLSVVADELESNSSTNLNASVKSSMSSYGDSRRQSVSTTMHDGDVKETILNMSLPEQKTLFNGILNNNLESSAVVYQIVRPNKKQIREFLKAQKKKGIKFAEACPCEN